MLACYLPVRAPAAVFLRAVPQAVITHECEPFRRAVYTVVVGPKPSCTCSASGANTQFALVAHAGHCQSHPQLAVNHETRMTQRAAQALAVQAPLLCHAARAGCGGPPCSACMPGAPAAYVLLTLHWWPGLRQDDPRVWSKTLSEADALQARPKLFMRCAARRWATALSAFATLPDPNHTIFEGKCVRRC